jgi:hypothetical protein
MALTILLLGATLAHADLDQYLKDLDVRARADIGDFKVQVGAHFGVPAPDLDLVFRSVPDPADAFLCIWLGQKSRRPYDVVIREYRAGKGKGWGALAQSLGIKPGSPEFKALKAGNLGWSPAPAGGGSGKGQHEDRGGYDKGPGKGHGKGK